MKIKTNEGFDPLLRICFENQIRIKKESGRDRTASNYYSSWKKLSVYLGDRINNLTVKELTPEIVQGFVRWLVREGDGIEKLSPGTQDFYLRNLKTMYKKVLNELDPIPIMKSPFDGLHIKVPPTRKRALPSQSIKNLATLDLSENPQYLPALHLALFLFYARGMCFIDVFKLQQTDLTDGYIHYVRSKTGVALQVKVTPEMKKISEKYYQSGSPWIFPFLHEKIQGKGEITPQSSLHRINDYLKKIGKIAGFPYPLTTYVMRHSWASMMLEADSGLGVISQSLGHTSLQTTEIYLGRLSIGKIDKAADNMLDHLVRPSKKKENRKKEKSDQDRVVTVSSDPHLTDSSFPFSRSMKKFKARFKQLASTFMTKIRS